MRKEGGGSKGKRESMLLQGGGIPHLTHLCLSCSRLCREVDHKGLIDFLVQAVHQLVLDVHTLTSTRGTHK